MVKEYYRISDIESQDDKKIIVKIRMPENGWPYGYILSFDQFVEVIEPEHLRKIIKEGAEQITALYE